MDKNSDDFFADSEPEENFEELLNQSIVEPIHFSPGEKVEAAITKIAREWVFIDLGGKSEGCISIDEFMDDENNVTVKEGETISAYFLSSRNSEMRFTTRLTGSTAGNELLEEAFHSRIPVEGVVEKEVKGGFEVKIPGNTRAFCPYSQMGFHRIENAGQFIGSEFTFKIIEYSEKGRNIILSNRAVLEEERQKQKDALREKLKEGMTVSGEITSIRNFGAFVDIGGVEGLIPISEISWGRVEDIHSELSIGQKLDVSIKKLDWGNDKFSFSIKDILSDPWDDVSLKYPEGSTQKGKVARLTTFGAFVTLEPGIDGLVHISELGKGKKINHPRDVLEKDQTIEVKVLKVNQEGKRLSLTMVSEEPDSNDIDYRQHMTPSNKKTPGSFGTLGDILREKMKKR